MDLTDTLVRVKLKLRNVIRVIRNCVYVCVREREKKRKREREELAHVWPRANTRISIAVLFSIIWN